jgi:hypothetical protein
MDSWLEFILKTRRLDNKKIQPKVIEINCQVRATRAGVLEWRGIGVLFLKPFLHRSFLPALQLDKSVEIFQIE